MPSLLHFIVRFVCAFDVREGEWMTHTITTDYLVSRNSESWKSDFYFYLDL